MNSLTVKSPSTSGSGSVSSGPASPIPRHTSDIDQMDLDIHTLDLNKEQGSSKPTSENHDIDYNYQSDDQSILETNLNAIKKSLNEYSDILTKLYAEGKAAYAMKADTKEEYELRAFKLKKNSEDIEYIENSMPVLRSSTFLCRSHPLATLLLPLSHVLGTII